MSDIDKFFAGWFACLATVILVILITGPDDQWREDAIKHNAAQFNPTTGDFEWLDEVSK